MPGSSKVKKGRIMFGVGAERLLFAKYCRQEHEQPATRTCSLPGCLYVPRSCPSLPALWGGSGSVEGFSPPRVSGLAPGKLHIYSPCPKSVGGSGSPHPPTNPVGAVVKHCEARDIPAWHYAPAQSVVGTWGGHGGDTGDGDTPAGVCSLGSAPMAAWHMPQFPRTHPLPAPHAVNPVPHSTEIFSPLHKPFFTPWCCSCAPRGRLSPAAPVV